MVFVTHLLDFFVLLAHKFTQLLEKLVLLMRLVQVFYDRTELLIIVCRSIDITQKRQLL